MKVFSTLAIASLSLVASAQVVVPNAYAGTPGTSTFLYMVTTARTYQYQINANQLTGLVGQNLNGLQWRLPTSATGPWPPADASFASFDITIGEGVAPASRSTTLANNFVGTPTVVRTGALTIPTGSFSIGGSPNPWGPTISFSNYLYNGGHLTIEMRHTGMTGTTTTRSFDALSTTTSGYGTDFGAYWTGSYTGTTGGNGNFFVTRLTGSPVPEPASMIALALGASALVRRRRKA